MVDIDSKVRNAQADAKDREDKIKQAQETAQESREAQRTYPYDHGDVVVLGQGIFADPTMNVVNIRGINYVRQVDAPQSSLMADRLRDMRTSAYLATQEGH